MLVNLFVLLEILRKALLININQNGIDKILHILRVISVLFCISEEALGIYIFLLFINYIKFEQISYTYSCILVIWWSKLLHKIGIMRLIFVLNWAKSRALKIPSRCWPGIMWMLQGVSAGYESTGIHAYVTMGYRMGPCSSPGDLAALGVSGPIVRHRLY